MDYINTIKDQLNEMQFCVNVRMGTQRNILFGVTARLIWCLKGVSQQDSADLGKILPSEKELLTLLKGDAPITKDLQEMVDRVVNILHTLSDPNNEYCQVAFMPPQDLPVNQNKDWVIHHPNQKPGAGRLSPVEFICTGLLIAQHPTLNLTPLAAGIRNFRNVFHAKYFNEKKTNNKVMRTFRDWEVVWAENPTFDGDLWKGPSSSTEEPLLASAGKSRKRKPATTSAELDEFPTKRKGKARCVHFISLIDHVSHASIL